MHRLVPNSAPVGNDCCLSPIEVDAAAVIVDTGGDCYWYPHVMNADDAERLAFAIMHGTTAEAYSVTLKMILPSASDVRATTATLDRLTCQGGRLILMAR